MGDGVEGDMSVAREGEFADVAALARFEPLSSLSVEQLTELAEQTPIEAVPAMTRLFSAGETDNTAIYLLKGKVALDCSKSGTKEVVVAGSNESAGALSQAQPRCCTATALSIAEVIRIDRDLLDTLLTLAEMSHLEPEVVMSGQGIITIDKGAWFSKMLKSPSFRNLPVANIEQLFERLDLKIVTAGEVVIRQGDVGDYFYMINEGTAQVSREIDDEYGSIEMAELSVGSSFGEAALISDSPRNATVSMMSDGVLLRLSKEDFLQLLKEPALTHLSEQAAAAKIAVGGQWLDIRQRADFDAGHREGALHASLNEMHLFAQQLRQNRPYVCYCQTGQRSAAAAFVLSQYHIDVYVLG